MFPSIILKLPLLLFSFSFPSHSTHEFFSLSNEISPCEGSEFFIMILLLFELPIRMLSFVLKFNFFACLPKTVTSIAFLQLLISILTVLAKALLLLLFSLSKNKTSSLFQSSLALCTR